jgi:hypothetical protein
MQLDSLLEYLAEVLRACKARQVIIVTVRIPTKIMQKVPDPLLCLDF